MSDVLTDALPFALTRPIHVADVALKAKDVPKLAEYYRHLLGLETIAETGGRIELGAGGVKLLSIEPLGADGLTDDPRSAGLFHTAFLMPTRLDLGRWILHASKSRIPVDGMSDHLVSEAIYLTDPEGNGIEIYSDRPVIEWPFDGNMVKMATNALDINAIIEAMGADADPWDGAPELLRIGHVHLRVGNFRAAHAFWRDEVGLQLMANYPGAAFLASGGYHHHIGANQWSSANAGMRDPKRSGLSYVTMTGSGVEKERELVDPWGTVIRMVPG